MFWQEFLHLTGIELTPNTNYHLHLDMQTEIVNKWVEDYLRYDVVGHQKEWISCLGEHYYNTIYYMSIELLLALYGYQAQSFVGLVIFDSRVPGAKDLVQQSQSIMKTLQDNLYDQNQHKLYGDQHRIECAFELGDMVCLKLYPYM